ncbi:MAG: hypothetical protein KKH01_08050 [Firmicutes bacterium]|nr:hypothetical protein [Bacillota bacterium]
MKKYYIIFIGLLMMMLLSGCRNSGIYTVSFYDISTNKSYLLTHTNEKVFSIFNEVLYTKELPMGINPGLIIFESDTYIGISPCTYVQFSSEQLEDENISFIYTTYSRLTEPDLVVTWYEKETSEKISLTFEDVFLNVSLGYYPAGTHSFYAGAYELGVYDNYGYQLQNMFLYSYGYGFTISWDYGTTVTSKFGFKKISIENTLDDIQILLPSQYVGGVDKLDLEINEKQFYNFENHEVELFAIPFVKSTY